MNVPELIESETFLFACQLVRDREIDDEGLFEWDARGAKWSIQYDWIHEDQEIAFDDLYVTVTKKLRASPMILAIPSGQTCGVDHIGIEFEDDFDKDDGLAFLSYLIKAKFVSLGDALDAIEEDDEYDEQDYLLFKVAHS